MRLLRIDHVQVTVPRLREKEARHFYATVLGLREIERPKIIPAAGMWFAFGEAHQLHIVFSDNPLRPPASDHYAVLVDDLDALKRHLADHDVPYQPSPIQDDYERMFVQDPFGNRVEFMTPRGGETP